MGMRTKSGSNKNDKNKIVFVTEHFHPTDSTTATLLTEVAEALAATDHNLKVICNTDLGGHEEVPFAADHIVRIKAPALDKNRTASRLLMILWSTIRLSLRTMSSLRKGDHLFSVTNPAFLLLAFALMRNVKRCNYTLLVYDVFPENTVAAGILTEGSIAYRITRRVFDWAYRQADELIVIGRDMEEVVANKTRNEVATHFIPNWCDVDRVLPIQRDDNEILIKLGLENKIVFSFVGNFGRVQGIPNLLAAAAEVTNEDFALLFVGDGAMRPEVEAHIDANRSGNVYYAGTYPATSENCFLNACDVAVVSLGGGMYGLGVPSKSYHNMAAAKPLLLIGDKRSEIGRVIAEHDIGWVVEPDDPEQLTAMFEKVCAESTFEVKGEAARRTVEAEFSMAHILEKYRTFYR
ncbi:MAG: glycosyltransferase involved in cell wall biosynthesis [Candidatus Poriferisodalaceae bacterium]|jgi:glycosyltransferase involved in cell wall biosynthesis